MAAQAVAAVPAIPAPLTGAPFMKASHFQLGAERQAPATARQSFSHSQFPPHWGVFRPPPAPLPCSGHVLGPPGGDSGETCSETHLAFPEKPLQPVAPFVPPDSCVRMHADPRIRVLTPETRDSFPCPQPQLPPPLPAARLQKDSIPCGDREKIGLPASIYSTSYPAHGVQPAGPRPSRWGERGHGRLSPTDLPHRPQQSSLGLFSLEKRRLRGDLINFYKYIKGCVPTIRGDGQSYYNTSYQAQFKGEWSPPAKPSGKHISSIKFGDPTSSGFTSEQKYAYSAPDKKGHRVYDKERAVSQIHRTNVRLGDGCSRFSTSTSELFPAHEPEPVTTVRLNKNASSILRGDEDPERNRALTGTTTTRLSYPETGRWNFAPKPDLLLQKYRSNVCLGDERSRSRFFNTTQQADYQPPRQGQRVMADGKSHRESHIPFDYHADESSVTTTQAMLVPHRQQKQRLSEDTLQQMKSSHLELPWKAPDLFRTEQRDAFTPKSRGPAEIPNANCQVSSVPLGTLKKYCPKRRVHFAP